MCIWRNRIEKRVLNIILNKDKRVTLLRGFNNKLLTYSPYAAKMNTEVWMDYESFCKYSTMSKSIHRDRNTERSKIEYKIYKIFRYDDFKFLHLVFNEIQKGYDVYKNICEDHHIRLRSKKEYNTLCNLITKWRLASGNEHYEMSARQKRKLKKLAKLAE